MAERNSLGHLLNETFETHLDGGIEYWRDIPGYEGFYRASDWGRLKSIGRWVIYSNGRRRLRKGKILQSVLNSSNYLDVCLYKNKKRKVFRVHQLILLAFVGPRPEGKECRHFPDRDRTNNKLENIQWSTHAENIKDKDIRGTHHKGENNSSAILTEEKVLYIRNAYFNHQKTREQLTEQFSISWMAVFQVVNGSTWKHIGGPILAKHRQSFTENLARGENKGRTNLNIDQVLNIRTQYKKGKHTHAGLGKEYGVSSETIRRIVNRTTWKDI